MGEGMAKGLSPDTAGNDPIALFEIWLKDAKKAGLFLHNAITLATCTKDAKPSARLMLLKGFDERGFVLYTNYESRKAGELDENPNAALVIHWPVLERQIRVEGSVEKLTEEESSAYFRTRPRGSRLGAWASKQSQPLESPDLLKKRFQEFEQKYPKGEVPLPPFWGGIRVRPERIEFWQGRLNRLHDRVRYEKTADGWEIGRLYP